MSAPSARSRFGEAFAEARRTSGGNLCIGLDPDPGDMPEHLTGATGLLSFCGEIVSATSDLVAAYKPNAAFFERFGSAGWHALEQVIDNIPQHIPVIIDAKRGDIGNTSRAYAEAVFDHLRVHACTVNPYLGRDAVAPLVDHPRGFAFLLCRTSNSGAGEIQDLDVAGEPLYARVIRLFQAAIERGDAGLVIGAQARDALAWADRLTPDAHILVPGIGAQGGTPADLAVAVSPRQSRRIVVSVSRAIIHASRDRDFAVSARDRALAFHAQIKEQFERTVEAHGAAAPS